MPHPARAHDVRPGRAGGVRPPAPEMTMAAPCIVLAGGLGTRLRDAVPDLPKCLAPVGARSFLEIQIESLAAQGVERFVLSLGYRADAVESAAARFRLADRIEHVVERQPLGTGGAILNAMHQTGVDEALVVNGDTFIEADLSAMQRALALEGGERFRMAVIDVPDRARYGGVTIVGDAVIGFVEKGVAGAGPINAGLYRIHRSALAEFAPGDAFSIESRVAPVLAAAGALRAARLQGEFIDI